MRPGGELLQLSISADHAAAKMCDMGVTTDQIWEARQGRLDELHVDFFTCECP